MNFFCRIESNRTSSSYLGWSNNFLRVYLVFVKSDLQVTKEVFDGMHWLYYFLVSRVFLAKGVRRRVLFI